MKLRLPPDYVPQRPHPKQAAFLLYDGLEAFFGGAAGPGKSSALLMGALQYIDNPHYAAIILRKSYADLSRPGALMDRARQWLEPTPAKWDREKHSWTFPSGASLTFGYIQTPADMYRYQSMEVQYIGWDEVTDFVDDSAYLFMFSRLRRIEGSGIPLRVRSASNPVGPGVHWVRKRFVFNDPPPAKPEDRIFIAANFYDNPSLDHAAYLQSLSVLPEATQERLIGGSWEAIDSAAFPHFDVDKHVVEPFRVPQDWKRWEGMDYGTTNPTAWYSAALSHDGFAVIQGEYVKPGLISQHASAILTYRENQWGRPIIALCDPSIQARTGFGQHGRGDTIHSEFSKHGLFLVPANNDRRAGFVRIGELLREDPSLEYPAWHQYAGKLGSPRLFLFSTCTELIEQMKFAPLDPTLGETIDPYWESRNGHSMAACRYLMTAKVFPERRYDDVWNPPGSGRTVRTFGEWTEHNNWKELV